MSKRAAIYARFSTELQSDRSADDQIRFCRQHAETHGYLVVLEKKDEAMSGASIFGRTGLGDIMAAAESRQFDTLIIESVDRLSRDHSDAGLIKKKFDFLEIEIVAINQGAQALDSFQLAIHSALGQQVREEGAKKVRRGMRTRAEDGLHMGGAPYGYRPDPDNKGKIVVADHEAAIILRIYKEYAAGKTPRKIAIGLNADHIPAPRGSSWCANTINGSKQRRSGILRNDLYKGDIVWGKVRMLKKPDSNKRISRPQEALVTHVGAVPAIVSSEIWNTVAEIKGQKGKNHSSAARKAKRPLSGLLRCGACGGGMSSRGIDKTGKTRIQCSRHAEGGQCPDPRTYYLEVVEREVFSLLANVLREPEMVQAFVETYNDERKAMAADSIDERKEIARRLAKIEKDCDRWTEMLFSGDGDAKSINAKTRALREDECTLKARLSILDETKPEVQFQPDLNLAARYAKAAEDIQQTLARGDEVSPEIIEAVRMMVSKVVIRTGDGNTPDIETFGLITALSLPAQLSGGLMVAGVRYFGNPQGKPGAFCVNWAS